MNDVALRANDVLCNDVMLRVNDVTLHENGLTPHRLYAIIISRRAVADMIRRNK